jgi:2,3-bisphosphoglycerate-independent phosphoglycerate mutase
MAKLVLLILDGFGIAPLNRANPRTKAQMPTFERLEREALAVTLQASGVGVGLPWGEPGNSETGHLTIGAGRLLYHALPRIIYAIRDGSFFENAAFRSAFAHVKRTGGNLHAMGLTSSGSVHAYIDHLYALFEMAKREGVSIALHAFTDGRDAEPREAAKFLPAIEERMKALGVGRIASIIGRHYAMDRDGHWDRTEKAYRLLTEGKGEVAESLQEAFARYYAMPITDEMIPPTVVRPRDEEDVRIRSGDALIFFNFREDSARQIAQAFGSETFSMFPRPPLEDFLFVTMTEYGPGINAIVAFPPILIRETLGEVLSLAGLSQLRIAETEKYAHVTYFLNGGIEPPFPREDRLLIPSFSDASPDVAPVMRAFEIAEAITHDLTQRTHDIIIANFANADMVGHTGNFAACIETLEALDAALGKILRVSEDLHVPLIVTADHGNIEEKIDLFTGHPLTEHSLNPVPFLAFGAGVRTQGEPVDLVSAKPSGLLSDVAPTILELLGIRKPQAMTGRNLLG